MVFRESTILFSGFVNYNENIPTQFSAVVEASFENSRRSCILWASLDSAQLLRSSPEAWDQILGSIEERAPCIRFYFFSWLSVFSIFTSSSTSLQSPGLVNLLTSSASLRRNSVESRASSSGWMIRWEDSECRNRSRADKTISMTGEKRERPATWLAFSVTDLFV